MRILLFSSTYPPIVGGVETVTRRLARELKGRGHEVLVVTNRYPRSLQPREQIDGLTVIRRLYPNLLPSPGPRRPITLVKQGVSPPLAAFEILYLVRLLRAFRPDVLNAHYFSYPVAYALLAAQMARIPSVLCFHGSDVPAVPYPATYPLAARWGSALAERVICCSENLRSYLLRDLPEREHQKVSVSHYGIDPDVEERPESVPLVEEPFALLPARLVEKKGVDVALRAVAKARQSGTLIRLVIAGSGPLGTDLKHLASELGVTEQVRFLGSVGPPAVRRLMERSAFVVVPSHWEAFGMVCLEAMVGGKAVAGSSNGGISEIVVDGTTGLLVPPNDAERLARAMSSLWHDRNRADEMGQNGRRRALAAFTWEQMLDRYETAFRDAVQRKATLVQEPRTASQ